MTDVLAMYGEMARAIAGEIQIKLTPEEETRFVSIRQANLEAYEAYLKGQFHMGKMTPPDIETALQYYDLSLEKDPNFARAYAGIALGWAFRSQFGLLPPREAVPRAKEAAEKAVELDSTLAEAQYALATVRAWHEWDWEGAEKAFRRAIELNPSYPDVRAFYSHFLNIMGHPDEALAQIERALELDPFNAMLQVLYGMDLVFEPLRDDPRFQDIVRRMNFPE